MPESAPWSAIVTRSLSVLLPVHADDGLESLVDQLLELLPDLTPRFDVTLMADAAAEALLETADELAVRYPQVRVVRCWPRREEAAVRQALAEGNGRVVLVWNSACEINSRELLRLWRLMDKFDAAIARTPPADRWSAPSAVADILLLRRTIAERLHWDESHRGELTADLTRLGAAWCEVELARRTLSLAASRPKLAAAPGVAADAAAVQPRRPRYLQRLKEFALGE
jgi:hypothetical protein